MCTPELVDALFEASLDPPDRGFGPQPFFCDGCGQLSEGVAQRDHLPHRSYTRWLCVGCMLPPLPSRNQDTAILYWAVMVELGNNGFLPDSDAIDRQDELEQAPRWG